MTEEQERNIELVSKLIKSLKKTKRLKIASIYENNSEDFSLGWIGDDGKVFRDYLISILQDRIKIEKKESKNSPVSRAELMDLDED